MKTKPTIILDPNFRKIDEIISPDDWQYLNDIANIVWGKDEPMPLDEFMTALPEAEIIISTGWRYGEIWDNAPQLRAILDVSGGFPSEINYDACFARNIRVLSSAPSFARQVAEMSLAMALSASREVGIGDRAMRNNTERWLHQGNTGTFMLYDQPVGFIGYGSIARELHPLLKPFGVSISVYDPWIADRYLETFDVTPVDLETLMETSQVIFVLATPTIENVALLSRDLLAKIQPGAVLVLISRAHVIDFDALTEFVVEGRFKAAIDVFPTEPVARDHPIRQAENAVLSAHRAGSVREGLWEIGEMVIDDLQAIVNGFPPRRMLNAEPELIQRYATSKIKKLKDE